MVFEGWLYFLKNTEIFDPIDRICIPGGFQPSFHSETASSTTFYLCVWKKTFCIFENPSILSTPGWLCTLVSTNEDIVTRSNPLTQPWLIWQLIIMVRANVLMASQMKDYSELKVPTHALRKNLPRPKMQPEVTESMRQDNARAPC